MIQEAEALLPKDDDMQQVFSLVATGNSTFDNGLRKILKLSQTEEYPPQLGFLLTGVAYLANRGHDTYIREVGTMAWYALEKELAILTLVNNMRRTMVALGLPGSYLDPRCDENQPRTMITSLNPGKAVGNDKVFVLIPKSFPQKARQRPVEALAFTARVSATLRDTINGRISLDPKYALPRNEATGAHLLLEALRLYPGLDISPECQQLLKLYPLGINSLPKGALYQGITISQIESAAKN